MSTAHEQARLYYVIRREGLEREGPYTATELHGLVVTGVVGPQSRYWHEGMAEWRPVDAALRQRLPGPRSHPLRVVVILAVVGLVAAVLGYVAATYPRAQSPAPTPEPAPSATPVPSPTSTLSPAPTPTPVPTPTPSPTPAPTPATLSVVEIVRELRPAVALIKVNKDGKPYAEGTGWLLSQDGIFVTNYHVVEDNLDFTATFDHASPVKPASFLYADPKRDFAIFRLADSTRAALRARPAEEPALEGEDVVVLGNPLGLEGTVTTGVVSGLREFERDRQMVQITAAISHGSSGSPVVDNRGRVLGMATLSLVRGQALNFAVPIADIAKGLSLGLAREISIADLTAQRAKRDQKIADLRTLARQATSEKDYPAVVQAIADARREFPNDPKLDALVGWLYYRMNRLAQIDELFRPWLSKDNPAPEIREAYADILLCLERYAEAQKQAEDYLRLKPESAYGWELLGTSLCAQGQSEAGLKALKKSLDLDPERSSPWYEIGREIAASGKYAEGAWYLQKADEIEPGQAHVMAALAACYVRLRLYVDGIALGERFVSAHPSNIPAWAGLALCCESEKKYVRAAQCYEKLVTLAPQAKSYWVGLAAMYDKSGRRSEALRAWQKSQTLPEPKPTPPRTLPARPEIRKAQALP